MDLDPDFDVGKICLRDRGMPNDAWHTVSLLRTVALACSTPPWTRDGLGPYRGKFKRDVAVTSAAARLYERGFDMDRLVRSGLGQYLHGAVVSLAVQAAVDQHHRQHVEVPRSARELGARLLACVPGEPVPNDTDTLFFRVLEDERFEPFVSGVAEWIRKAPRVAELLCWQLPGESGGASGSVGLEMEPVQLWLLDRFLLTYLADWSTSSLHAEHRWLDGRISSPLAPGQLELRLIPHDRLNAEIARRAVEGQRATSGFSTIEGEVLELLRAGRYDKAVTLVHGALFVSPRSPHLRNALAFCLIPSNPSRAEELLRELMEEDVESHIVLANRAMAAIQRGDPETATRAAIALESRGPQRQRCCLWDVVDGELLLAETDDPSGHTRSLLERTFSGAA